MDFLETAGNFLGNNYDCRKYVWNVYMKRGVGGWPWCPSPLQQTRLYDQKSGQSARTSVTPTITTESQMWTNRPIRMRRRRQALKRLFMVILLTRCGPITVPSRPLHA